MGWRDWITGPDMYSDIGSLIEQSSALHGRTVESVKTLTDAMSSLATVIDSLHGRVTAIENIMRARGMAQ